MNKNSIYKYYYYLAAINLVTICSTIWIADRIHNIYTETIKASQEWNHRISLHEELETIIIHGNGPGNNIFISNNLEFEKKNFDTILINFDKKIDEIEVDNLNFKNNDEVIINISKLKELVQIATSSTFQIFDYYKKNDIPKASFYMAKMDESFHLAILKTIEIRKILRNLKNKELIKRHEEASYLYQQEISLAILVLFVVLFILFFGKKLKLKMIESDFEIKTKTEELISYQNIINDNYIISRTDANGIITFVNENFCKISQYSSDKLIGKTHQILNSSFHNQDFFHQLWSTLKSGNTWQGQIQNKSKDGKLYWVESIIGPIKNGNGEITEFLSINNDITEEKKRINTALEISHIRARYIELIDSNSNSNIINYLLQKLIKITKGQFGFLAQIQTQNNLKKINLISAPLSNQSLVKINTGLQLFLENEENYEKINSGEIKKNQHEYFQEMLFGQNTKIKNYLSLPIHYSGKLIAIFYIFSEDRFDIQNLQFFSKEILLEISQMLFTIFTESEIQNAKKYNLHQSKLASIGQLAAGIGHEINNPLAIISGYISNLNELFNDKENKINPLVEEKINKINRAISRIENLVKGLRNLSRSDEEISTDFNFHELILETVDMLKIIYEKTGTSLTYTYDQTLNVFINGNRGRLQQVLINLFNNAKDSVEGRDNPHIEIKLVKNNNTLELLIIDNGHGIPEEIKDKIFEPFFTTKEIHKGTGIGLSLVSNIIKEHHGHIRIQSKVNTGTTFSIILPLKQLTENSDKGNFPFSIKELNNKKSPEYKALTDNILIVDDEEDLQEILELIIFKYCKKTFRSSNVNDAIKILEKEQIDLVISDIKMPFQNGFDLLKIIRNNKKIKQPHFFFVSGGVEMDSATEIFVKQNANGVLPKPYNEELIQQKILEIFLKKAS